MTQAKRMVRASTVVLGSVLSLSACAPGVIAPPLAGGGGVGAGVANGGVTIDGSGATSSTGGAPGTVATTGGQLGTSTGGRGLGSGGGVGSGGSGSGTGSGSGSGGAPTIAPATGGQSFSSGGNGNTATGGAAASTGGRAATGSGGTSTGGRSATGGAPATGDRASSGGATTSTTTGGAPGTGGRAATGGAPASTSDAGSPAADGGVNADATTSTAAWRPFADSSPWNTPIGATPSIDPSSTSLVNDLVHGVPGQDFTWINLADFSVPVYYVDATTPVRTVSVDLAGQGFDGKVPIPAGALPDPESDHHFCIVNRSAQLTWSMWDATISPTAAHCTVGARTDLSGSGIHPLADVANPWQASVDARACGFPLIAGLIRVEEIRAGRIAHALVIAYPHIRSRYYVSPASTAQGTTDADAAQPNRGIPCGGRVQLDPTLDVTKLGLSPAAVIIARALQEFGAYVGDYSGSISLYAENAPAALVQWNAGLLNSNALGSLDLTRLRVLTIGALHDNNN